MYSSIEFNSHNVIISTHKEMFTKYVLKGRGQRISVGMAEACNVIKKNEMIALHAYLHGRNYC